MSDRALLVNEDEVERPALKSAVGISHEYRDVGRFGEALNLSRNQHFHHIYSFNFFEFMI